MITVVAGALAGIYARSNVFDGEAKGRSRALAVSCVDMILLRLSYDDAYAGPETITIDADECQVVGAIDPASDPRVYQVQGVFQKAYTNLLVTIDVDGLAVAALAEVAEF